VPIASPALTEKFERHHHVLESHQRRQQMKRLKHESHVFLPKLCASIFGKIEEILTGKGYLTFGRQIEARQEP